MQVLVIFSASNAEQLSKTPWEMCFVVDLLCHVTSYPPVASTIHPTTCYVGAIYFMRSDNGFTTTSVCMMLSSQVSENSHTCQPPTCWVGGALPIAVYTPQAPPARMSAESPCHVDMYSCIRATFSRCRKLLAPSTEAVGSLRAMGCGNAKVLPEASKKGYVSVVQSLVAFSRVRDDDQPKKRKEKRGGPWFSAVVDNSQPTSNSQTQLRQGCHRDKVARYKDKFEPRVTAR